MSKVITEENLKTLDLIKELFCEKIKTNEVAVACLDSENRYPEVVVRLLEKGEPFCFENEGEIPFIESPYNWELRMPNKKKKFALSKFDLPISFKSSLKYLDEYTQRGFKFFIQYNSNESLTLLVDDLEFDKDSDTKRILTAYYRNEEKNLDDCFDVVLNDTYIQMTLHARKPNRAYGYAGKAIKLTDEIKNRYGIEVPNLPLPY